MTSHEEFEFVRRPAPPQLARWVDSVWFARGQISYTRERIAPTGATVAVLILGDPIMHSTEGARATSLLTAAGWLTGPHDRPSINEPQGVTHCYGIVATPIGCRPMFGLDPRELRGRVAPLEAWSLGCEVRAALRGIEPDAGLSLLLDQLTRRVQAQPADELGKASLVAEAVASIEASPGLAVSELAGRLGISHAHLDRQFARVVGISPRRLAGILRMRRLLEELDVHAPIDWAERAVAYGWYDQSHMVRDFRRYAGVTPGAYVTAQREHFSAGEAVDASGFVPAKG